MGTSAKVVNQAPMPSGGTERRSRPYRSYLEVTCLEMERARRVAERKSALLRIALIDERLHEIEQIKRRLLQSIAAQEEPMQAQPLELRTEAAPRRAADGFNTAN